MKRRPKPSTPGKKQIHKFDKTIEHYYTTGLIDVTFINNLTTAHFEPKRYNERIGENAVTTYIWQVLINKRNKL